MKEPKLTNGDTELVRGDEFIKGICERKFELGSQFGISKESKASLKLVSAQSIYYETSDGMNILIVKENGNVPFYTKTQMWGDDCFKNDRFVAVIDLRAKGLYGTEYNPEKLNDGRGNYGSSFFIRITPMYFVYFNKENAQEEMANRLNKIKGKTIQQEFLGSSNWVIENILNDNKTKEEKALQEDFKEVKEQYKQFTLINYKEKTKENNFLAAVSEAIKSDYSSDVKILMVKDIVKRYDIN